MTHLRAPRFWDAPPGLLALGLSPLSAIYAAAAARRLKRSAPRADLPTLVVGGLTLGGDGKTPLAIALAEILATLGEKPAILSRGYGRRHRSGSPVVVDPARHSARDVGDEALLQAATALTIVCADRPAAARRAETLGATAVVLDDGLHSRALAPDLAFLVVDAEYGAGSGHCPPAGPLRAPLSAQAACADVLVVVGEGEAWRRLPSPSRLLRARLAPDPSAVRRVAGERVFAFAGVGRPQKFRRTLEEAGAIICGFRVFPDHHLYSRRELETLAAQARALDARLLTTQKDAARLGPELAVETLPVSLVIEREDDARLTLREAFARARDRRTGA
jgi:tetraacyldisaccharide 4'-kinase